MNAPNATFSRCELYRYMFYRPILRKDLFDLELPISRIPRVDMLFVMANPSTATAEISDPTCDRVVEYARAWGYSGVYVANVNPYRSTDPKLVITPPEDILRINDAWLISLARRCGYIVAAWGNVGAGPLADRAAEILCRYRPLHCLNENSTGTPVHPLYQRADLVPRLWRPQVQWMPSVSGELV